MATYKLPTVKNLDSFRLQVEALFAQVFGSANAFTSVQTFPAGGIVLGTVKDLAGSGSPEGVVTAPIGSTYRRTNGGAGTSFYVKESGSGSSGWVGK